MKNDKTILITGATGMIGGHLIKALDAAGYGYMALTTHPGSARTKLPGAKKIIGVNDYLQLKDESIFGIINLAGANLGEKRWTEKNKKIFYDSRIDITKKLVHLTEVMPKKPEVLISASGVDYYGNTGSADMYEDAPPADTFLGKLTHDWEAEAMKAQAFGVRTAVLRTGFVIAVDSDAVKKLLLPYKLFVGGPLGGGKQYVSWIHIDDLTVAYLFILQNNLSGVFNASSPNPESNKDFGKSAAKVLNRPAIFPVPAFMLKVILGEMSAVVLDGRRALPGRLLEAGFRFKFIHSSEAWKDILE
ncbi:MAG: TIGR01777 family oxidoreductase [Ignavibacteria bacterium]|nr:TIGR01777 family oxidoreductase [Ignavibacteria bacterium]